MKIVAVLCSALLLAGSVSAASLRSNGIPKGYVSLGSGYFKTESGFDYFYADGTSDTSKWIKMKGASGDLKDLKGGYACGAFDCYFLGRKFSVSGDLKVLFHNGVPSRYASDAFSSYWLGKKIKGVAGELEAVSLYYAKDAFHSFWKGSKMQGVAGEIKSLGRAYANDDMSNLFFAGKKIGTAQDFKLLDGGYAISSGNCYYNGKNIGNARPGGDCADLKTFKVNGKDSSWAKGNSKIYHKGQEFGNAMGKDVSPLGGGYVKVGHKFFFKGAETTAKVSLKVFGETGYALDGATELYYEGNLVARGVVQFDCEDGAVYCGAGHLWFYKGIKLGNKAVGLKPYDYGFAANQFFVFYEGVLAGPRIGGGEFKCLSVPGFCGGTGNWYYGEPGKDAVKYSADLSVKDGKVVDRLGKVYFHGGK